MSSFSSIECRSFRHLQDTAARIADPNPRRFTFRGYCASPTDDPKPRALVTGLERACLEIDGTLDQAMLREVAIVREFMRRAHHYLPDTPRDDDWIEWLALMQHHGAPTRLLDWTYSLQVAAHFALVHASRESDADLAIWMVNTEWCLESSKQACITAGRPVSALTMRAFRRDTDPGASKELLLGFLPPCVWPITPFRLNERLTLQKGIFLAPADVRQSFAENLTALPEHENQSNLVCLVLKRSEIAQLGKELYDSNVTETTLFPGLDGFARSLWVSGRHLDLQYLRSLMDI
jgi:hypothetical protein